VKYIDPDGRELLTAETTKEQYDEMVNKELFNSYPDWGVLQEFFTENPDGAYYRPDGDLLWKTHENKDDIKIIDPNVANVELLFVILGGRSLLQLSSKAVEYFKVPTFSEIFANAKSVSDIEAVFLKNASRDAAVLYTTLSKFLNNGEKIEVIKAFWNTFMRSE
jgi:hypothetical protein